MTSNLGLIDTPQISGSGEPIPDYAMYDSGAVALATFLGGPIPGSILMAHNYRRMGEDTNALMAILVGVGAMAAAVGIGFAVPQSMSLVISGTLIYGMRQAAESFQGPAVNHHANQGGKLGSKWVAAGLGMVFLAAILAIILPPLFAPKVMVGTDEVFYSGAATKEEAQALGDRLKEINYFTDRGVAVILSKDKDNSTAVGFVIKDDAWERPEIVADFEDIGRQIAPAVGGFPIKVRLANEYKTTKKEVTVGRTVIGTKDEIFYYDAATNTEANALGQELKSDGFFIDRGFSVFLSKGSNGTTVSFVVKSGWDDAAMIADFENKVRHAAPGLGGLPIQMRLVNQTLEVEKETTVN